MGKERKKSKTPEKGVKTVLDHLWLTQEGLINEKKKQSNEKATKKNPKMPLKGIKSVLDHLWLTLEESTNGKKKLSNEKVTKKIQKSPKGHKKSFRPSVVDTGGVNQWKKKAEQRKGNEKNSKMPLKGIKSVLDSMWLKRKE